MSWLLPFLWGMFFGYIVAMFELANFLIRKGYKSMNEIEDKNG
jgi:hypothetical protein